MCIAPAQERMESAIFFSPAPNQKMLFWHRAQFSSWLQHKLLEAERMLYFEGGAAGENLLLFVLDCKSPSSAQRKG